MPSGKIKKAHVVAFGLMLYLAVVLVNDGFMALDEYWVGITRYIPAQTSSVMSLVKADDVKSPLQLLPMHLVAQAALSVGITSPYLQYRCVILVIGMLSAGLLFLSFLHFAKTNSFNQSEILFLLGMLIFYFAAPFALTRPMFEAVAAPWLTLASVMAYKYDLDEKLSHLLWGVFFASLAFVLRQQLGFCALVFVVLTLIKKNWRHFLYAGALGLLFFIVTGIPDYFIRGKFHYSLLNLTLYNFAHGADYGDRTIFFYPILIVIISLLPFFIKKYPVAFVREYFRKYRSLLIVVALFVFLHSLFPQKWERFIISIIPLLILLVFPFLYYLHRDFKKNKLRLISLYSLNGMLFLVASFFPAQKNLIEMSLYLNEHPEIKKIHRFASTPEWITEVFILNKQFEFTESDLAQLKITDWTDCSQLLVVSQSDEDTLKDITAGLQLKDQFNVNLIEQLAYKMNPKNNIRRVKLSLFGCQR